MNRRISMPGSTTLAQEYVTVETFPDGEAAVTVPSVGRREDVVLIGSSHTAQANETFLAAAYELALQGPASLTVGNTYFRHARCDRKFGDQAVMAKFQARQWSGLGSVYPGVRLAFLDLHNDLVLNYFEGPVRTSAITALPMLERARMEAFGYMDNIVYATVDHGGVFRVRSLAEQAGVGFAHIDKLRLSGTETTIEGVHGDVNGCDVVIFDDMIATGGSLVNAAKAYKDGGANRVFAVATHGLFVNNAIEALQKSCIEGVLVTDSHPNAVKAQAQCPSFISIRQVYADHLVSIM